MKDELEYWKKRCELAEDYISKSPCDPDIYVEQMDAYNEWEKFKRKTGIGQKSTIADVSVSKGTLPKCEHKNIDRQDGCDECLDCGVRNY